jgi:transposase InsO family protein
MVASMSRKANCWDNAVTEAPWATIKRELTDDIEWSSKEELEAALFEYIEIYYNRTRLHSTLDYITPAEYDSNYWQAAQAA